MIFDEALADFDFGDFVATAAAVVADAVRTKNQQIISLRKCNEWVEVLRRDRRQRTNI